MLRKAIAFGLTPCSCYLKILVILSLNLCFVSEVQIECARAEEICNMPVLYYRPPDLQVASPMPYEHRIPVDPQCLVIQANPDKPG